MPNKSRWQVSAERWSLSADGSPGGDFVLTLQTDDVHRTIVADVCGHGRLAAVQAARVRRRLERDLRRPLSISRMRRWNRDLGFLGPDGFVCVSCVEIDIRRGLARIANAGNPSVLVQRSNGGVEAYANTGMVLGMLDDAEWCAPMIAEVPLCADDRILCFTDGLTDRMNSRRETFGLERVERAISLVCRSPLRALRRWIGAFEGRNCRQDDLTVLCLRAG